MQKLPRYGLLLLIIFLLMFSFLMIATLEAYANDEYTEADKTAAIMAANDAISLIPPVTYIMDLEQSAVIRVKEARDLVDTAKELFDAQDSDFSELDHLIEAEKKVLKLLAIKAAQEAIAALPPLSEITEDDRDAIEEARRLITIAMEEHGATRFDICWYLDDLEAAEDKIGEKTEPEPPADPEPLPPTGGVISTVAAGFLVSGLGLICLKRRQKSH